MAREDRDTSEVFPYLAYLGRNIGVVGDVLMVVRQDDFTTKRHSTY